MAITREVSEKFATAQKVISSIFPSLISFYAMCEKTEKKEITLRLNTRTSRCPILEYNPEFVKVISDNVLAALVSVELFRLILHHPTTRLLLPAEICYEASNIICTRSEILNWNIAQYIQEYFPTVSDIEKEPGFKVAEDMFLERVFNILMNKVEQNSKQSDKNKNGKSKDKQPDPEEQEEQEQQESGKGEQQQPDKKQPQESDDAEDSAENEKSEKKTDGKKDKSEDKKSDEDGESEDEDESEDGNDSDESEDESEDSEDEDEEDSEDESKGKNKSKSKSKSKGGSGKNGESDDEESGESGDEESNDSESNGNSEPSKKKDPKEDYDHYKDEADALEKHFRMQNMKKNTEGWGENSIIDQKVQSQVEREKSNPMTWGTMPNDMKELITIANRVKMDPRAVLKRFARSVLSTNPFFTRRKPSKKDPNQDWIGYIPGKTYEQQAKVLFAVDTSGSMREEQIAKAIAFFMSALSQADVYFCWWDAKCGTIQRLKKKQPEMEIVGGGGTVPNCVIEKVRNERLKFDGIVFITDCYFEFPNPLGKEKIFIMKTDDAGQAPDWCKWVLSFKDIERC